MADGVSTASERSVAGLLGNWAAIDRRARLICDQGLGHIWSNAAAREDMSGHHDLVVEAMRFGHSDPALDRRLADHVRVLGAEPQAFCLPLQSGEGHIVFKGQEIGRSARARYIGLTYHRTGDKEQLRYADLENAFALGRAEHLVLLQILKGLTAQQAAQNLDLPLAQVQAQIRQVYAHIGVRSRAALFRRLGAYQV